ncbi:hypothetical protein CR513_06239, partial [Mucuna pruriens]
MAEYKARTMGITMPLEYQEKTLKVYEDSVLVVHQLRGEWKTRYTKLIPYYSYVKELTELSKRSHSITSTVKKTKCRYFGISGLHRLKKYWKRSMKEPLGPTQANRLRVKYYWAKMEADYCDHASNGHRFILVAIDYFTKWVEAASYANVTRNVVIKFIKKDLIY